MKLTSCGGTSNGPRPRKEPLRIELVKSKFGSFYGDIHWPTREINSGNQDIKTWFVYEMTTKNLNGRWGAFSRFYADS